MVKSTRNPNQNTPIVALATVEQALPFLPEGTDLNAALTGEVRVGVIDTTNKVFDCLVTKPVETADVVELFTRLGLEVKPASDGADSPDQTTESLSPSPVLSAADALASADGKPAVPDSDETALASTSDTLAVSSSAPEAEPSVV